MAKTCAFEIWIMQGILVWLELIPQTDSKHCFLFCHCQEQCIQNALYLKLIKSCKTCETSLYSWNFAAFAKRNIALILLWIKGRFMKNSPRLFVKLRLQIQKMLCQFLLSHSLLLLYSVLYSRNFAYNIPHINQPFSFPLLQFNNLSHKNGCHSYFSKMGRSIQDL